MNHAERAARLGYYAHGLYRAGLGDGVSLSVDERQALPIFVHEYWHYLQDITTVVGVPLFQIQQSLLALFSKTLIPAGQGVSAGSSILTRDEQQQLRERLRIRDEITGDAGPRNSLKTNVQWSKVREINDSIITVDLHSNGFVNGPEQFRLGTLAIEESTAYLVELHFATLLGSQTEAPEFPYRVLERIVEHRLRERLPPLFVACLGTLALLGASPYREFFRVLGIFAQALSQTTEHATALEITVTDARSRLSSLVDQALPALEEIVKINEKRGMSDAAVQHIVSERRRALEARLSDPIFEIRPLLNDQSLESAMRHLTNLMSEYVPCDLSLRADPITGEPARIVTFQYPRVDELGFELSQYIRSYDAQQKYVLAHLNGDVFVSSDKVEKPGCAFVDSCVHPLKSENENQCRQYPWLHIHSKLPGCWYTSGVLATMGTVKIKKSQ